MKLVIPNFTKFEDRCIFAPGEVYISRGSQLNYGLNAKAATLESRVMLGGDLKVEEDAWIGSFSKIAGNIQAGLDVYLGDFVQVGGGVYTKGKLELGHNVNISQEVEAARGIQISRSLSSLMLIWILILIQLMNPFKGSSLNELLPSPCHQLLIPVGAKLDPISISTRYPVIIGRRCRILGSIHSSSQVVVGARSQVLGKIRASSIFLGPGSSVSGDLIAKDQIRIQAGTKILGDLSSASVLISGDPVIEGTIRSSRIRFSA